MNKWLRVIAFVVAILAVVAVGITGTRYHFAKIIDQIRLQRQRIELIHVMRADGRSPEEIEAAVDAMNRRYER